MEDILAHKDLLGHTDYLVFSIFVENDDIVEIGTVADKLILLHARSDEAVLTVDVELFVGFHHLGSLNGVETFDFCETRMLLSVFVLEILEPVGRHFRHVRKLTVNLLDFFFDACNQFIGLVFRELGDALHLDFKQTEDVVLGHLANHLRIERRQPFVDVFAKFVGAVGILKRTSLIDTLLDKDFFQ